VRGVAKVNDDDELARAWHELMGSYQRVTCTLDRELHSAHGISASDFEVLQQLYAATPDRSLRMHDLGQNVHLTQSALSRLIARLEGDGLVERRMCTDDRRSVWTAITAAGIERYLAARPTQRAILREQAVGCLGAFGSATASVGGS
jgi:DNA-binding MarR family transcriptional regulator